MDADAVSGELFCVALGVRCSLKELVDERHEPLIQGRGVLKQLTY
jgi:hypothetical protein